VQLLWGLWNQYSKRKQEGRELDVIVDSQGTKTTLHLQHIMDSYSRWLHGLDFFHTPHDDDPDGTAIAADSDGVTKMKTTWIPSSHTTTPCLVVH
jgi:hypothetical protein